MLSRNELYYYLLYGGTFDHLIMNVHDLVQVTVVAPLASSDDSLLSTAIQYHRQF